MNNKDTIKQFFNERAPIWDEICYHDPDKMDKILKICDIKQGDKVMDVGCGTGVLTKKLINTQATEIVGIDLSDKMIEVAKANVIDDRVSFIADDFYHFNSEQFDCIVIYSAYPHFIEKTEFAEKIHELLKPGGKFVIAHSQSKEDINNCHNKKASNISTLLQPPEVEFQFFKKSFQPKLFIDNEKMYIIVGQK